MIGEIAAAASRIDVAMHLARGAKTAADALGDAGMKFKIADIYSALTDVKAAIADAEVGLAAKDKEIDRLKQQFQRMESDTVELAPYRFRKSASDGQPAGRPFCPRCLEVDGYLILTERAKRSGPSVFCPQCKTNYNGLPNFGSDG